MAYLLLLGMLLIAAGIFALEAILPTFGLMGLIGLGITAWGVMLAFDLGQIQGWAMLALGILACPLGWLLGLRAAKNSAMISRTNLKAPAQERNIPDEEDGHPTAIKPGMEGVTTSALRPMGMVDLGGRKVEASAMAESIPPGTAVRVAAVNGGKIMVERKAG